MSESTESQAVVVTFREVERILLGTEAAGQIQEAANVDNEATPVQKASVMAAIGNVLKELRKAEENADALVMTTPQHDSASRLQSLIASGEAAKLQFEALPSGGLEAKFDTRDWFGWAQVAWEKLKHLSPHPMARPRSTTPEPLPEDVRIAVLGDWGTGLYGAPRIGAAIRNDPDPFHLLLHLGDVYYSGTEAEVKGRFLEVWPYRNGAINRALNSNHEMYSGGEAYFGKTLPRFGQESSYFAFQNKHWTLVGLDVAYEDHAIDDAQVHWLEGILAQAGERKVIFFSHHQLYSHFESQGTKLWNHTGFGRILKSKRVFAWFWGHEHRCTIFEERDKTFGLLARCIGHGGMPQNRRKTRHLPMAEEVPYSRAEWVRSPAQTQTGNLLPACVVLEGANTLILGEEEKFSPHGYAVLVFNGPELREEVRTADGQVIYERML